MPEKTTYSGRPRQLRLGIDAVIFDDEGRVLLHRRDDNGDWGLPGGGMEVGETLSAAVTREVAQETGYEVEPIRLIGVYSDPHDSIMHYPDDNVVQAVSCVFECRITGGEPEVFGESIGLEWVDPDDLPANMVRPHRTRIADAHIRQAAAFFR
jgi:8-oxo-dGTP pyrophosphatase MutT (NUDIX family)